MTAGTTTPFGQFQYPTPPLGVSSDFMNTMMRKALGKALHNGQ